MPRFEPFSGLRYDPSIPLDEVVAPPYDVVGPQEREKLASRHAANSIHVELPVEDPSTGRDKYGSAAQLLRAWIEDGVLLRDETPSMYAYRMIEPEGGSTTGVIGALGCEPPGGDVLPHEQTIPKDMTDRLELLRACRANLSPIWGLSLTSGLASAYTASGAPEREATDDDGVVHQLWRVDDPDAIGSISKGVAESPVVIADGHHRYETALAYQSERREANGGSPGEYDLVMAVIVELAEEQLSVGPIHRLVSRVPPGSDLTHVFTTWFDQERVGDPDEVTAGDLVASSKLGLLTPAGAFELSPRPQAYDTAGSDLDSSLVALALEGLDGVEVSYVHHWREATQSVASGNADAAILTRPVTVKQISQWAHARRRMPPKSTYFHPKLRTGMVFRTVEG